jgi:hypothetical protein
MSLPPWLTAAVAAYGALLATANLVLLIRAKRWRIVVTHTYLNHPDGTQSISIYVANLGERSVTIVSAFLQSEVFRATLRDRYRQWVKSLRSIDKSRIHKVRARYPALNSLTGHVLPAELKPGESIGMQIDLSTVALAPVGRSYVGVEDGLGRSHYSRKKITLSSSNRVKLNVSIP